MITQNDLQILKAEVMADTADGGGLPTSSVVVDGVSNNLFPDVSDLDRKNGRVRLRKVFLGVQTANADLLQAARLIFTELPSNPNISVFAFKATSFADRRADAKNKIESYLAFGTKMAGHLLETQLAGQRVIQLSLDVKDVPPSVNQPLVLVQNEGMPDEFYQYIRPTKVDITMRQFQRTVDASVTRQVVTIEFSEPLKYNFVGLTVPEFYRNADTARRAILREARVADAAKYYSASKLAEPIVAMQTNQAQLDSIYTQIVPSTQVETPLLQRDPVNNVSTQARGASEIAISQTITITPSTAFNLAGGIAIGSLNLTILGNGYSDRNGELINNLTRQAVASINYGTGTLTWYSGVNYGSQTVVGSYKPAAAFVRVAQTDYQKVGDNAGYNFTRELGAVPVAGSLRVSYTAQGGNYTVFDDGRGNLIDDKGNGRGTILDKSVLLTTAVIPDMDSYIIYTFGVDLDTVKYGQQALKPAYHVIAIDDYSSGDITITWGDKTATANNDVITGDATGVVTGKELHIAPNVLPEKDTEFTLSYQKALPSSSAQFSQSVTAPSNNGEFEFTVDLAKAITGSADINVEFKGAADDTVRVWLKPNTAGTALDVKSVMTMITLAGSVGGVNTISQSWIPSGGDKNWQAAVISSAVNKTTGVISFKIRVTRDKQDIDVIARAGVSPIFKTVTKVEPLTVNNVEVSVLAVTASGTAAATSVKNIDALYIEPPTNSAAPIVNGSLIIKAFGDTLKDKDGVLLKGADTVGQVDYASGGIKVTIWAADATNTVTLMSLLRENDPVPLTNLIFRTPSAPLKKASLQINCTLADGTRLTLSTDEQGKITGSKYAHGEVDFKLGVVMLYFYEKLGVTANPDVVNQPWYDAANIYMDGSTNYINKPIYVKPDSIRYNAVTYSYLPLDSELIGLDTVRLPVDGRVPFVRKGDNIAITELKTMALPTNARGDHFDLGFERLSDVMVVDSTGKKVSSTEIDLDLDGGLLALNDAFDVLQYTLPLTAKYRIMDIGLVIETDISGRVTLSELITHDYTTNAVFSSMLIAGDMQARAYNVFSQKSWTQVFSDTLIGDRAAAQLQTANHPIVVTNKDALKERWALVFTGANTFNIIGETLGQIGTGDTLSITAPINPQTGQPYFTIAAAAWSSGWSAGNVVRFNTDAAQYPLWLGNAIGQHTGSSKDNYDFTIGYHANVDRERVE